jgi:hypothetical protein
MGSPLLPRITGYFWGSFNRLLAAHSGARSSVPIISRSSWPELITHLINRGAHDPNLLQAMGA